MKAVNGIPILGYGTWPLAGDECYRGVLMALELGIRHIDTAQIYGNEREVGRAISASGVKRSDIFLVTKIAYDNLTNAKFAPSVDQSLDFRQYPRDDRFDSGCRGVQAVRKLELRIVHKRIIESRVE